MAFSLLLGLKRLLQLLNTDVPSKIYAYLEEADEV